MSLPGDGGRSLARLLWFYLLAETLSSIDTVAITKGDIGQLSLLRAAHFLLVCSWVWDDPWS